MKSSIFVLVLFSNVMVSFAAEDASLIRPKSLQECFEAALGRSELVAQNAELIKQAEEIYHQAIGSVLPTISAVGAYQFQQNAPESFATLYPNPSTSSRVTLTQPLFQGFKEYAGLRQTKTLAGASKYDKMQAATQLYLDTAASYFGVVSSEQDVDNIVEELEYYDQRIKDLNNFVRIGRSQVTDVLTAESQKAALKASMMQIEGQLKAQRAVLSFLTGWEMTIPLYRPKPEEASVKEKTIYLDRVDHRPDVQADAARARAAGEGIPIARAGHLPTLSLQGDYFLERTGALSDINWDIIFNVTIPLFNGGIVQSQVAQAVSKRDQADLQVSRTRRLAEQQVKQFYELYVGDTNQFHGYTEAADLAEKNYKAEVRNYKLGLVTNLDVLSALTTFQESKRSTDKARFSMLQDAANLEAAGAFKPQVQVETSIKD